MIFIFCLKQLMQFYVAILLQKINQSMESKTKIFFFSTISSIHCIFIVFISPACVSVSINNRLQNFIPNFYIWYNKWRRINVIHVLCEYFISNSLVLHLYSNQFVNFQFTSISICCNHYLQTLPFHNCHLITLDLPNILLIFIFISFVVA